MYIAVDNTILMDQLADLARQIWTEHFGRMISADILEQVIENVQSKKAINKQIENGFFYYLIPGLHAPVGYFAYQLRSSEDELFLSKLYVLATQRNRGLGRQVVCFLEEICKKENIPTIGLTVYEKNESAIKAYQKMGFASVGIITRDLGNGIVADDVRMQKPVQ